MKKNNPNINVEDENFTENLHNNLANLLNENSKDEEKEK